MTENLSDGIHRINISSQTSDGTRRIEERERNFKSSTFLSSTARSAVSAAI
jgi:hypothetical protein